MNNILHVYRKELRDMFRDKRVRSSAFIGPMFMSLMFVGLIGVISSSVKGQQKQKVHVVATSHVPISKLLGPALDIVDVPTLEEGQKLIQNGKARLVLNAVPAAAGQVEVDAYVDPKEQPAQILFAAINKIVSAENKAALATVLKSHNLPETADETLKLVQKDVQVGEKGGTSEFLTGFLPYLIVIWAFYGGMSIASDLVAGEKEKNTLETLLISPAPRTQIVLGKFFALATVCLLSSLSSLIGFAVVSQLKLPGTEEMFKNGFGVTLPALLVTLAVLLPLVSLFASMLIALSSYARNPREAQTYLAQFSFIVILPAVFSQVIGLTDAAHAVWVNFIPILNTANNIRMALMGKIDPMSVGITVVTSLVLALAALRLTVYLFNREEVLVRV
jgi:sodium transport system permease protein